jgi:enoyl-CoA hydratase/carnithine racemase
MNPLPLLTDATLSVDAGVALLTLRRNDVRNALTGTALVGDIIAACEWINLHHEVGALVLHGDGKAFSAGGNIKDMQQRRDMFGGDPQQLQDAYRRGIQRMSRAVYNLEVPSIAALNGAAIGAGLDLACMCDIRIGCEYTKAGETFVNLGIIPGDGGAWFLPRIVGISKASEMAFTGDQIDADEALACGLVSRVVPDDKLMDEAMALAKRIAVNPPHALRMGKRLLREGERTSLQTLLDMSASMQALAHKTEDHVEAISAFVEKRAPVFKGK